MSFKFFKIIHRKIAVPLIYKIDFVNFIRFGQEYGKVRSSLYVGCDTVDPAYEVRHGQSRPINAIRQTTTNVSDLYAYCTTKTGD